MSATVMSRVNNGVKKLNAHYGDIGWVDLVKQPVRIVSGTDCILGQLFGDYSSGKRALFGINDPVFGEDYGFLPKSPTDAAALDAEWASRIKEMRSMRTLVQTLDLRTAKPRRGDKVRITYETTMPATAGPVMLAVPLASAKVEVIERRRPEPGDRVRSTMAINKYGFVVQPKQAALDYRWVVWDNHPRRHAEKFPVKHLTVEDVNYGNVF